jgi:hypothetical protein
MTTCVVVVAQQQGLTQGAAGNVPHTCCQQPATATLPTLTPQAKAKALREAIFKINQKHGQNTVMQMTGDYANV